MPINITSANENSFLKDIVLDGSDPGGNSIWLGHTDNITEGRWIIETGPESGTVFWEASCVNNPIDYPSGCPVNSNYSDAGTSINERYNHWNSGEPNNSDASNGENLLEFQRGGGWNDLNELNVFSIDGYVVEFSGNFTGVYSASVLSIPTPIISISTPLAQLTSNCAGIPSVDYTTFDINGLNLTSAVNVSAPSGFEISTVSNTSYASSLSLSPISNSVSSTIFIRLSSSATTNGASGTITATSSGATTTTTTISSTPVGSPSFVEPGTYLICSEGTYSVSITTSNYSNGWSVSSPNISVNSTGYVTAGTITGTYTLTYTDACAQSISRNVIVNNSNNAPAITYGQASYKISNSNPQPQGPTANIYVGYNGFNYYSATQPTNTGFYKANNQSGSSAGCPYPFYIFRCTTCPD